MRRLTVVAGVGVALLLLSTAIIGFTTAGLFGQSGTLEEMWQSDTLRDNRVNHHPVAVGPDDDVIIAPVTAVPNAEPITATSCSVYRLAPTTGTLQWRASIPPDHCFSHAFATPAITDLSGDERLEAVTVTTEHAIVIYNVTTGTEQTRIPLSTYGYGQPTIGNLTPTPGPEIAVVDIDASVFLLNRTHQLEWEAHLEANAWASPIIADVDADGQPNVLVATSDGAILLDASGDPIWRQPGHVETITTGQTDEDPALEVVVPDGRTLTAYDGATTSQEWRAEYTAGISVGPIHDTDRDGDPELYSSLTSQTIVSIDPASGTERWRTQIISDDSGPMPPPVVANVTGDGSGEVIAAANDGTVAVLDATTGEELAAYERAFPIWTVVTPIDLDDDGDEELLVRYGDGRVIALNYETT